VLPLFMALVMGALDYGWFFYSSQVVTNAAREAARAGTLVDPTIAGAVGAATTNAKLVGKAYMNSSGVTCAGGPGDDSCIAVTFCPNSLSPPSSNCGALPGGSAAVDVVIDFNTKSLTGFTSIILPPKVHGRSIMRW